MTKGTADLVFLEPRELRDNEPETTVWCAPICYPVAADPSSDQLLRAVESSGTLDFWDDASEDIYSPEDGEPL